MRPSRAALLAFGVVCAAYAAGGCGGRLLPLDASGEPDDSGAGTPAIDGAALGDDGGARGPDAGSGPSGESEGGVSCASSPTGPCNVVALQGVPVTPTTSDAAPPPMSGGTIADGTYVLTAITTYGGTMAGAPERATLLVAGDCIQSNDSIDGPANVVYSPAAQLTFHQACSGPLEWWSSYTASPTLVLLQPSSGGGSAALYTYTRQ